MDHHVDVRSDLLPHRLPLSDACFGRFNEVRNVLKRCGEAHREFLDANYFMIKLLNVQVSRILLLEQLNAFSGVFYLEFIETITDIS